MMPIVLKQRQTEGQRTRQLGRYGRLLDKLFHILADPRSSVSCRASASYIAAPAAMRISLPDANPSLYLTASLGITFPFNIALGIPLYLLVRQGLLGGMMSR